jgi:hypothetical protein
VSWLDNLREKPEAESRRLGRTKRQKRASAAVTAATVPSSVPYQVDPKITRVELIGAHTKWLYCTVAFWTLGDKCETSQPFVPQGYWFETGRPATLPPAVACSSLTGNEPEVPVVKNCRFKQGLTMVLPAINALSVACKARRKPADPRIGAESVSTRMRDMKFVKATLDGKDISSLDAIYIQTQDGDANYGFATDSFCIDEFNAFNFYGGCPLYAGGAYVFIDTSKLPVGSHELILIGTDANGFCSAVKHQFTLDL